MTTSWDPALYEAQHSFVWQLSSDLLALLAPQPGEHILDLGCGTGQLTAAIAEAGAVTVGVDASPDMIGQARQNYPRLRFILANAESLSLAGEFDAVFSNASLHWMLDTSAVARSIAAALRPGGRLVLECGGKGNIQQIEAAIHGSLTSFGCNIPASRTVFRSIGELSVPLEAAGLEVTNAVLFDRPTRLEGEAGMSRWLDQFAAYYFAALDRTTRENVYTAIIESLRPTLFRDGAWFADYRRLRVLATRLP